VRGGLVLVDLDAGEVVRTATFQYNPDTLRRRLARAADGDGASELVELKLALDATDWLSAGDPQATSGIGPQLAALESVAFPPQALSRKPLTVFVWGRARIWPVSVLELVVTEEAFDRELHPIRATVTATLELVRFSAEADGPSLARATHEQRARLAEQGAAALDDLGLDETDVLRG